MLTLLQGLVEPVDVGRFEPAGRNARADVRRREDFVGCFGPEPLERRDEELPQRSGVAFFQQLGQRFARHSGDRQRAAVGQADFDLERVAAIDRRRARGCRVKLARHHLPQALQDQLLADRRDAIGRWRGNLRLLDRLIEHVGLVPADLLRVGPGRDLDRRAEFSGDARADARKRMDQELRDRRRLRLLQHRHQPAQLDAVRVRLDFLRLGRKLIGHPGIFHPVAVGIDVMDRHVRIGDGGLFEIIVDAAAAALVAGLQLDRDARAVLDALLPLDPVLLDELVAQAVGRNLDAVAAAVENLRHVPLRVDLDFVIMGRIAPRDLRDDLDRLAGGQQAVHARRADADALLAAAHPHAVELRAVEQLAEDQRDLFLDDAGAVVLHADLEAVLAGAFDVDPDFGQDAGLFAGVQGVVDRLLDGGQQGLPRVVEAQQVAVLGEELADGNIALAGGHRLGGGSPAGFRGGDAALPWACRWNRPASRAPL